ncbi:MAG: hypothetical protein KAH32_04455, partial [Chlamydiia bacterium]|nr:hypothetical protein [Chlamydiia bacterium]
TAVDATKWEYKGERYSWTSNKGLITIAGDKLDEIFFSYSKYGLNWSRSKVCRKLGISPRTFRSLAMVFFLSKDSNIYAPHISNTLDAKELDEYVTKKLDAVYKSGERIEVKYSASLQRAKQAEVDKLSIADLNMKDFLGELAEGVKVLEKTVHIKSAPEAGEDEIVVALSDLHIGAVVHNVLRTRDYTTEILEEYLTQTAEQANEKKAKKVTVVIAGDILAGGPLNHPNSFKSMDMASLHGYQTILANNVLMRFFNKINNLKSIVISGGNHSRSTSSNKEDTESTMAAVIAYFLKETYKDKIEVLYHYDVVDFSAMGMHFIVFHGDRGFHKRDISEIILYHGDPTKYNVLISGHYHSLKVQDKSDTSRYIKMTLPSIYTGDEYSASLGFSSLPGFVIIEQGRVNSKVADLQVIRL